MTAPPAAETTAVTERLELVPWALVDDNPWQPRTELTGIEELAAGIKTLTLLQPPIVRQVPDGRYQLLFGHRRKAACVLNGEVERELLVKENYPDEAMAMVALEENAKRVDLKPLETYKAWQRMLDEIPGLTQQRLADQVHLDRSTVANYLRVLHLPAFVLRHVDAGDMDTRGAREFLCLRGSDGHFHDDIARSVLANLTTGTPDWRHSRIRYLITRAIESSSVRDWRRLFKGGSVGGSHGGGEPAFDVEAFKKDQAPKIHPIANDDWGYATPSNGKLKQEHTRDWTCATSKWVTAQTKAKAAAPVRTIKVGEGGGSAASAAPARTSDLKKNLERDPVLQAAVARATITVGQKATAPRPFEGDALKPAFAEAMGTRGAPRLIKPTDFKALIDTRRLDYNDKPYSGAGISDVPSYFPDLDECRERCIIGATLARFDTKRPLFWWCLNQSHFREKLAAGLLAMRDKTAQLLAQADAYDEAALLDLDRRVPLEAVALYPATKVELWRAMAAALLHGAKFTTVAPAGLHYQEREEFEVHTTNTKRVFELLGVDVSTPTVSTTIDDAKDLVRLDETEACELALRLVINAAHESKGVAAVLQTLQREDEPEASAPAPEEDERLRRNAAAIADRMPAS